MAGGEKNRVLVSSHLHKDRDADLLMWLDELKEQRYSVSEIIRSGLYVLAEQGGHDFERQSPSNDMAERLDNLTDLVMRVLERQQSGVAPSRDDVRREVGSSLDPNMLRNWERNVARPGRGQLPEEES